MAKIKRIQKKIQESEEFNDLTKTSLKDIFDGNIFSKSYFLKQIKLIVLVSFFIFIYMDNRMECEKQLSTINDLNETLLDVKYTSMVVESNLLSISRRKQIEALLHQQGIELKELSVPPYKLITE
ncbi:MAG: hypothetical protein KA397_06605 [Paludibacteraceae bacterium]|nr:hypothetical protein [Paludibacteraceae bacterium]MBP6284355.1 hypothetical protein [Paludibacteraceae bacterium]